MKEFLNFTHILRRKAAELVYSPASFVGSQSNTIQLMDVALALHLYALRVWVDINHGLQTHNDQISNSLQPKFISQTQIETPVKCMKTLAVCRKCKITDQGHTVTKFEQIVIPKIPYAIPQNLFRRSAKSAKIFGILKKKLSLGVRST